MPRLNFVPERDGWHFINSFENRILPGVLHGVSTYGLCGGMAMSALDYWRAGIPIPVHTSADLPPDRRGFALPAEGSRLRNYIYDRQINSLLANVAFLRWITSPLVTPNDFHSWATGSEFNRVVQELGNGRPAMLGLWSMTPGDLGGGHQVLCYGWESNPIRLYIYDPNRPDEETILTPISPAVGCRLKGTKTLKESFYRGYFFTDVYNWGQNPPFSPPYRDLELISGLTITPSGPDANIGTSLSLATTVQNVGEYPSRFRAFTLWARDPSGKNIDASVGGIERGFNSLNPGQTRTIARNVSSFGTISGSYVIGVSKESHYLHWQDVPPGNSGAAGKRQLRLWPVKQKIHDLWVNIPESARADIDTTIVLRPGDEFALSGTGSIWAGVWFTGSNGPEGWEKVETNPGFPLNNRPDARPFSLIGRFEGEGYFYVGNGTRRRSFNGSAPRRLFLRINDNTPANGSGSFQCLIEVWR